MSTPDVSNADCCCFYRPYRDFSILSERQVTFLLKLNQISVLTVVGIQFVISCLWQLAVIIPGFSLYDGAAGTVSAYTHAGWWTLPELTVIFCGAMATYFGLNYSTTQRVIEKGVVKVIEFDTFFMVILGINAVSHGAHLVLTFFELSSCTGIAASTFCRDYKWAFIMLIVFLFVLMFLSLLQILRIHVYKKNLEFAVGNGKVDTTLSFRDDTPDSSENNDDVVVDVQPQSSADYEAPPSDEERDDGDEKPSAPQADLQRKMRMSIQTPLLSQLATSSGRHGFKKTK